MKKIFTTLFFLLVFSRAFSQKFGVDTLYKTGAINNRLNVVILGDGFTQDELPKFTAEAKKFADFFLSYAPYNRYRNYFNFFSIPTPSKESGASNPGTAPDVYPEQPVGNKDTFYGGTFGSAIHRLVTVNYGKAIDVLSANFPSYDLAVVLVNSTYYGGSGGSISVHTLNYQANLIGMHEIGHTLSRLNDEYWAGPQYGWEAPNMTANSNPGTVRWRNWLNSNNIGIRKHGSSGDAALWYKPTDGSCLMELLNQQLCAVCKEATAETILYAVNPVEKVHPDAEGVILVDKEQIFKLDLVLPTPNSLQVDWLLNDKPVTAGKVGELTLSPNDFAGFGTLSATIFDSTYLSRKDDIRDQRTWKIEWKLESTAIEKFAVSATAESICSGFETTITASGCSGTTAWSTGDTTKSITVKPNSTTTYTASCKVENQVASTASAKITVLPLPNVTASNTGPYLDGEIIELSADGGISYEWSGPPDYFSNSQTWSIAYANQKTAGEYKVRVTDANGCSATAVTVVKVDRILAVGNNDETIVRVSPNPASEYLKVETQLEGESSITLYNVAGKRILKNTFSKKTELKLNMATGMYLYRFSNGSNEASGKVLIE